MSSDPGLSRLTRVLLIGLGCSAAAFAASAAGLQRGSASNPSDQANSLPGVYLGTYKCSGVETKLRLSLKRGPDGLLTGVFTFYPEVRPRRARSDSFSFGLVERPTSGDRTRLSPVRWEGERPSGYRMIGLVGRFDLRARTFQGTTDQAFCSGFRVVRDARQSAELLGAAREREILAALEGPAPERPAATVPRPASTKTPVRIVNQFPIHPPRKIKDLPAISDVPMARASHLVPVELTVGEDGKVIDATLSQGRPATEGSVAEGRKPVADLSATIPPDVQRIAIETARQFEYLPAIKDGEVVPVIMRELVSVRERPRGEWRYSFARPWTYTDVTMSPGYSKASEVESPLAKVYQDLVDDGFRCLSTNTADAFGRMEFAHQSVKVYLVECAGDCKGLTYGLSAPFLLATVRHLGDSRGHPLIELRAQVLDDGPIKWQFSRTAPGVPGIRVHAFTKSAQSSGGGCVFK
jgi:hypothetical protein